MKKLSLALAAVLLLACGSALADAAGLRLPAALEVVGEDAFSGTAALKTAVLPRNTVEIRSRAFAGSGLTEIHFPDGLDRIAEDAFEGSDLVRVYAAEGTYGYAWAVEHGYIALPPVLAIDALNVEKQAAAGAETHTWTAAALGGEAPYAYRYTLLCGSAIEAAQEYSAGASFSHTFFRSGSYVLVVQVKDAAGTETDERRFPFEVSLAETSLTARVRIFIACDAEGNILRSDSHTGHYELQLGAPGDALAFDNHVFGNPTLSFGSGSGGKGVVTVYDGDASTRVGCLLYTFEFTTSSSRVHMLLYEKLRDMYLDTANERETGAGCRYDVTSGSFVQYRIATTNCFTAVAAWCKWLGYGALSQIAANALSYTDYLAWRMYDRYGQYWTYEGQS